MTALTDTSDEDPTGAALRRAQDDITATSDKFSRLLLEYRAERRSRERSLILAVTWVLLGGAAMAFIPNEPIRVFASTAAQIVGALWFGVATSNIRALKRAEELNQRFLRAIDEHEHVDRKLQHAQKDAKRVVLRLEHAAEIGAIHRQMLAIDVGTLGELLSLTTQVVSRNKSPSPTDGT